MELLFNAKTGRNEVIPRLSHEVVWQSGDIALIFLPSALDEGEWSE
jgi:hypothetical protein